MMSCLQPDACVLVQAIAEVCALCNEAQLECKNGVYRAVGAPTEAALVCLVEKLGCAEEQEHSNLIALRRNSPEASPMPVTKAYAARCAACVRRAQAALVCLVEKLGCAEEHYDLSAQQQP